jgi:hypothetical protein
MKKAHAERRGLSPSGTEYTTRERERERERERAGTATPDNLHFGLPSPIPLTVTTLYTRIFFFTRFGSTKVKRYENLIKTKNML